MELRVGSVLWLPHLSQCHPNVDTKCRTHSPQWAVPTARDRAGHGRAAQHTSNSPQGNYLLRSLLQTICPTQCRPCFCRLSSRTEHDGPRRPPSLPGFTAWFSSQQGAVSPFPRPNANRIHSVLRDKSNQRTGFDKIRLQEAEVSNSRHCCFSEQHVERSADII